MRYVCPAAFLAVLLTFAPCAASAATEPSLSITNYHLMSEARQSRSVSLFTYSADLVNTGLAQPSITATVTSKVSSIVVQSGQASLHFPPAPANSTVTSTNFFTVQVDRSGVTDFSNLVWAFSTPVANAGPGQTVTAGATVTLNGGGSTNPSGIGVLSYSWAFAAVNGRPSGSAAAIQNPNSVMPTFVADIPGSYVIVLTVSNGAGVSAASVTVTTNNSPPVADAGPNQTITGGSTVTLNGSGSHDVDGNPLTYAWTFVAAPPGSSPTLVGSATVSPTFVATRIGTYKIQLTVNDGFVNSTPSQVTITSYNTPPVANPGASQAVTLGTLVQLDGSKSSDVDGNPLTYHWSFNSLPAGSSATLSSATAVNPTFTADVAGSYLVQLIVNDGFDDSTPVTVTISTNAVLAPTANAGPNQSVVHGANVALNGSGTDPQARPLTFHWSFASVPSGSTAALSSTSTAAPSFTADLPGNYVLQLIVNNGILNSNPSMITVTTTNTAPVADAGPNQSVGAGSTVVLDGGGSSDADHDPITYSWSLLSVPTGSTTTLLSPNIVSPTFIADLAGTYVVQLIVRDQYTSGSPATVTILATAPSITLTPSLLQLMLNAPGTLTVTLGSPAGPGGQVITLSVLDPSVASAPPTVTIPAAMTSATALITPAGGVGNTQIIASSAGFQPGVTTVNVTEAVISLTFSNSAVGVTRTVTGTILLSAPVPSGGITVGLSGAPGGIVSFPASVSIPSGNTATFTLTGVAAGSATVTAASPKYISGSATITAANVGAITLQSGLSLPAGQEGPFAVSLVSAAPVGGVTITLLSADTTKATVSSSVFIASGATAPAVPAQVTGINAGSTTITASANGFSGASANVSVVAGLAVSPASLPAGTAGVLYPQTTVSATGGTPPYILSAANLPNGMSFNTATGVLSGTPTEVGAGTITVKDSTTTPLTRTLSLTVNPSPLVIAPASLPAGAVNVTYTQTTVSASGGTPPYILTATNLPAGLSFNAATGVLNGTPTTPGTGTITVRDSAGTPQTGSLSVTINPAPMVLAPASLPAGTAGILYAQTTISASGGTPPYILSATNLPAGLLFNTGTGILSGTPTAAGTGTITVRDSAGTPQTGSLSVTINPAALVVAPASLQAGTVGVIYTQTTVSATGGTPPYILSATNLPAGLLFNTSTGVLSGTPTAAGTGTITVKDSAGTPQTGSLSVTINPAPLAPVPASLPNGTVGVLYSTITVSATGGTAPYVLSVTGLPAGLLFNTGTGVLSGTPTAAGVGTITIRDSASTPLTTSLTVTISAAPLVVSPASLPGGAVGAAYLATTVSASGGTPPYVLSATNLPAGLSFNTATGLLNGTPAASGTGTITVRDSASPAQSGTRTVTINSAMAMAPASLPAATVGILYAPITVSASGGTPPYILSASGLPAGLSFNTTTGVLNGTPTAAGNASITVTDSTSPTHLTGSLALTVNPAPLIISPASLPNGAVGAVYPGVTVSATGGTLPYIFSASAIPAGMSFSTTTGVLNGTPTAAGSGTVTVTDSSPTPLTGSRSFTINPPLAISPATLATGVAGVAYPATTVTASGGTPPYILSVTGLPAGMSFTTTTGVLNGTPTVAGSAVITIKDSTGPTPLTRTLTLTIAPPLAVLPTSLTNGVINALYPTITVSASGGTPPYVLSAASLPAGMSFSTVTGVLFGTPSASGTATISVKDSTTPPQVVTLPLTISPSLQILPATLPAGVTGVAYAPTTVSATGGNPPYIFSAANLPSGLSFNTTTGVVNGTPVATGTGTITVHDSTSPNPVTTSGTVAVNPGPLAVSTTSLANGVVNVSYIATVLATGGTPPYNFSATGLPAGLSMRNTGQITGLPTTPGTSPALVVTVTDSATTPLMTSATFSLTINPALLQASTSSLPNGTVGLLYNQNLTAIGGTSPFTWSIISGSLPSGLTLNPTGRIGGYPDGFGPQTTSLVLGVKDSGTPQQSAQTSTLSLTISPALTTPYLTMTGATIGLNLETSLTVTLNNFTGSTNVTISSDNPNVLFSKFPGTAGAGTITFTGVTSSFFLYAQALAGSGTANVTAHSTNSLSTDGASLITLTPSAFVLSGPNGVGASILSNQGVITPLNVIAVQLGSSGNTGQIQPLRAGLTQLVNLSNSNSSAGSLQPSVTFTGGTDTVSVNFSAGTTLTSTTITVNEPTLYSTPALNANMLAITVQQTQLTPSSVWVGKNLEAVASVNLTSGVTSDLTVTLTSSDPNKVLLSTDPTAPGRPSITMTVRAPSNFTQNFYVYGLASSGTVAYTATANGFGTATGLVTLGPSGFVLESPWGLGQDFSTITGGLPSYLNLYPARLDAAGNYIEQQALAGGITVNVELSSASPAVGTVASPLVISGGDWVGSTQFVPLGAGSSLLTVIAPAGFSTPAQDSSLNALVNNPNVRIDDGDTIGMNLEVQGTIRLGAPAPAGGANVLLTVTSGALLLSGNGTGVGSASISVLIPPGQFFGTYFMYGGDSIGSATVTATSPGYNTGTGVAYFAPSGVVISGPWGIGYNLQATVSAGGKPITVMAAVLDAGDNFQYEQAVAPRPDGTPLSVGLSSSLITVGTIASPVIIPAGSSSTTAQFTPIAPGTTVISAPRPLGFTSPLVGGTLTVNVGS